ncbi:MAG TPA: class I SAM-dependent methyltransferase [Stackebrandtia sp.]|jgi:SAM-dependent methyltransferase|uniref:class I SAM-dependent methyltransferase n=1 Tax=Stackebrandtia sp. TaxID=2023065 RepID=UPI002D393876|nr:class I SAM-dependent methyltransferase [Stackebrandtia sp.]HZE37236.1 class I SAM-dependent methyltransferase [Stackebrandtia sp.]
MEHLKVHNAPFVSWPAATGPRTARWLSAGHNPPPRRITPVGDRLAPAAAIRQASQGVAMAWPGGLGAARGLLSGMRRHWDRQPWTATGDPATDFYRHRQDRRGRARILGMLLVELGPDLADAVGSVYGAIDGPCVASLTDLLGVMSAHQWRLNGVPVPALGARIHPHYGVFAPTRHEYVDLVAAMPIAGVDAAFDIGTGTGVLAAVLAKRGVDRVIATDVAPAAVACARDNARRLGLADRVTVTRADLFPPGRADLVVCNPPWLPGTARTTLDSAVFDKDSRMLTGFLHGLPQHLNPDGQAWLVMSDLAELLGLRSPTLLPRTFDDAGLEVVDRRDTPPGHPRSRAPGDPLAPYRAAERVSLWRLRLRG